MLSMQAREESVALLLFLQISPLVSLSGRSRIQRD